MRCGLPKMFDIQLSLQRTYPNSFDAHALFQIDGNFDVAAGITEMLVLDDQRQRA